MLEVECRVGMSVFHRMVSIDPQVYKKLVIVGDEMCGKTTLLQRFANGTFPDCYVPTVFDTLLAEPIDVGITTVELALWDTPGTSMYDQLRPLSYPDKDVALICFNIGNPDSLVNVLQKWAPEVHHNCPDVPVILVGLQKDTRKEKDILLELQAKKQKPVSKDEGLAMAEKIGALCYLECSSRTARGIDTVFQEAARATLRHLTK